MRMRMRIRERDDGDLDSCVGVLRAVHERAGYPINWPADPCGWLTPPGRLGCWVAVSDGQVVGHVVLTATAEGVEVERLFVDPGATRQGIGRRLLDHCVRAAAELGLPLALEVADNGGAAVELYRRAGWSEVGRTPIDWGRDRAAELIRFAAPGDTERRGAGS
ncbi:GNAT family N-acetyltransferase [Kribbella sp. NPDC048915]|uniref:GNAT family N-acetyltransferase n=1 Tax=Kribbella sp. NPDC048915 TaxID=3155148 RepID=UPI0033D9BF3F